MSPSSQTTFAGMLTRFIDRFYVGPFTRLMPRQTFRFLACGGINFVVSTLVHLVAYNFIFAKRNLDMGVVVISPHIASLGVAWAVSLMVGFWMQKSISFRSSPLRGRIQLFRYFVSAVALAFLSYGLDKLFVEVWHIYPTAAFTIIYLTTAVGQFLAQKHYTFRGAAKE
jgi:putative flippase GtrA